jgi:anti-sigma factor RsiW
MNKPSSWSSREESLLLLNAYLDNELDAASVLEVERRIGTDAALKAELARLTELRNALSTHVGKDRASADFQRRIAAIADDSKPAPSARPRAFARNLDWRPLAAAAALAAVVASAGTYVGLQQMASGPGAIADVVAGHQRALLATAPFDVASSDRHTVKPWFDGKLALSPQVIDLNDAGFPLAGGRLDVVDGKAVPVSVYRRRQHVISLIAVPRVGSKDSGEGATHATRDGYFVLSWPGRDFEYMAVSDLAEPELQEFVSRWRSGAAK